MGTWGIGITSNDTYQDIRDRFFDLYNDGLSVSEVTSRVISENKEEIDDPDHGSSVWLAVAYVQWQCGFLDPEVLSTVKTIVKEGIDLDAWRHLGGSEPDLKKRKQALEKFLVKLSVPNPKPRKPRKKIFYQPNFAAGDLVAIKLNDGHYAGVVIDRASSYDRMAANGFMLTDIYNPSLPTTKDFMNSAILYTYKNEDAFIKEKYVNFSYSFRSYGERDRNKNEGSLNPASLVGHIDIGDFVMHVRLKEINNFVHQGRVYGRLETSLDHLKAHIDQAPDIEKMPLKKFFKLKRFGLF